MISDASFVCDKCFETVEDDAYYDEETGWCDRCFYEERREREWWDFFDTTLDGVEELAVRYDWDFNRNRYSGGFNTNSRYFTLEKEVLDPETDDPVWYVVKVRISDHGTMYCTEDISLVLDPTPDDHTLEDLELLLSDPEGHL